MGSTNLLSHAGTPGAGACDHGRVEMDDADAFERFAAFVEAEIGVRLPPSKRTMVDGRLRRRVAKLGLPDLDAYLDYLFAGGALNSERTAIFDAVTTNKTDFFREPAHFSHMLETALPAAARRRAGTGVPVKIWSGAASIGAEPWSIAMCVAERAERLGFTWAVLATDINTEVLRIARRAIYSDAMLAPVPDDLRRRWLMQGRGAQEGAWRVVPELRRKVRFEQLNLMGADYGLDRDIDIVFLRNVLIYFAPGEQARIVERAAMHLVPGGTLYLGHSESMVARHPALEQTAPATFVKVA